VPVQSLLSQDNHCLLQGRTSSQGGLDFAQFDTEPPQFDLLISTTEIFNDAIGSITRQISGTVETLSWMDRGRRVRALCRSSPYEWMGKKAFGGQVRSVLVPTCYPQAPNVEFSHNPNRHRVPICIQNKELSISNRRANGNHSCTRIIGCYLVDTTAHNGLGRSILVD
jgi:hypothetical protein